MIEGKGKDKHSDLDSPAPEVLPMYLIIFHGFLSSTSLSICLLNLCKQS